eukprot:GFUD01044838.1.p1 GENE.GFUD01044838.1~~GFUD01044838.1.p1  ORF type:complete len:1072 (+),score=293.57 GFUD01044838.1:38-3253(+)
MKISGLEMESTEPLLDSTIPDTPDIVDSVIQDSEEEEIFFGGVSSKEKNGRNAKFNRRETICLSDSRRRRSFEVTSSTKSRDFLLSQQASKGRRSSSRSSLYSQENGILEEDDDCVFDEVPTIQVDEVSSEFDEDEELELRVVDDMDSNKNSARDEERSRGLNVTGRKYRHQKYRNYLESIVSLPSATKVQETMDCMDSSVEVERRNYIDYGLEMKGLDSGKPRCENDSDHSVSSGYTGSSEYDCNDSQMSEIGPESDCSQVADIPVLEQSQACGDGDMEVDCSAETDRVSDGVVHNEVADDIVDRAAEFPDSTIDETEDTNKESRNGCPDEIGAHFEVSGVEPLSQTENIGDCSHEGLFESVHDHTAISHAANSTANSGIVTFKEDTSVSGVCDSFGDVTQNEDFEETDVQEDFDDGSKLGIGVDFDEESIGETSDLHNDSEVQTLSNVKRNIFEGESDMESFVLGSVASGLGSGTDDDISNGSDTDEPFTLGSVTSNLESVAGSSFAFVSVMSDLGSIVMADTLGPTGVGEMSLTVGDDSVFCRNSLEGHFALNHSFDVAGDGSDDTDADTIGENSCDGTDFDVIDVAAKEVSLHDQSEEEHTDGTGEDEDNMPQIRLSRPSLPNHILVDDNGRCSSPEFLPASPDVSANSIHHTAPSSHNASDLSPMFDTTAEEMFLFERFGESYDEKVEAMTKQEKIDLKDKLTSRGEEEITKVAENLHKMMQDKSRELSICSTVSPFSIASSTPSFHIPPDPSPQPTVRDVSPHPTPAQNTDQEWEGSEEVEEESLEFRIPPPITRYSTYLLPTTASLGKMVTVSPSPKKMNQTPWMPPSHSPSKSSPIVRTPLSRIPQPIHNTPQRGLQSIRTPERVQVPTSTTPNSTTQSSRVTSLRVAEYSAVASPVAEYVKSNPAPPLVQNVKAKTYQRDLESTLVEVEEKENMVDRCPLPEAVYMSGTLAEEQMVDVTSPEYGYIPEAYGTVTSSVKVTKHLARVRVGQGAAGLKWNESCLVNDESLQSSPSTANLKQPAKSVLKQTRRDSGLFDESMLEMSVHETKVVKKIARGLGRGKK